MHLCLTLLISIYDAYIASVGQDFVALFVIMTFSLVLQLHIQGVAGGMCQTSGGVPYVKVYRYNPKHLCPKLNSYRDNGQRKVWSSGGSTHCTCQLTSLTDVYP